ncbi:putative amidohydrolase YtcJ [Paenarthrobacter nitroguajacolicus]|uniref:amidohydrolase n=1 Tax=Paenarthrobacter nitroguajacolicus TaxID=211146 RepID=UPI00285723B2|nr:amidohydrolase [Paenarthrobacter nitroguajacolicus]MDR6989276.1 putative amidohydrolase YtcJ [Paenarthrobacter nitroguajacolicus]
MKLDLIIDNAEIITMDPARPQASRMGILHGRIVGLDEEISGLDAQKTLNVDGRSVVPGFIDAHCHTAWFGLGLLDLSVEGISTFHELFASLARAAVNTPELKWLVASGFDHKLFNDEFPTLTQLDAATGDVPLFLRHNSGHLAVVNSAALRAIGADSPDFPDPIGGTIARDAHGRPTGLVEETGQQLFQHCFQPRTLEDLTTALGLATEVYAREGITSFTEAGIGGGWIGHSPVELAAYQRAAADGSLKARAQLMPVLDVLHPVEGHSNDGDSLGLDLGVRTGFGSDMLSLGPVKVFLDGSLLGETAAVSEPYCSHGNETNIGYFQSNPDGLRSRIQAAYRSGWSIAAHAIGDRAIDMAIDLIADLQNSYGRRTVPNRIEHATVTRPEQVSAIAAAGIAVTPQASFFRNGGDGMMASLGVKRSTWAYRAASFIDAGVMVAGSSDRPVADGNVLRGMQAYVDRLTGSGVVFGGADERLTRQQALAIYTSGAAAATGTQLSRGSLSPGKLADIVVLSSSPLDAPDITELQVEATLLGGELTHNVLPAYANPAKPPPTVEPAE